MSNIARMMQRATAGAGGAGLDVDEVFSCFLYEGNNTFGPHTITNGIDLSGEGGLVWLKSRDSASSHGLYDTERGATKYIQSNATSAEATVSLGLTSFNNNGFSVDYSHYADSHASWTWRKAPKFFDVVTYTGDGTNYRNISHNLGTTVGHVIVKKVSGGSAAGWINWHRTFSDYQSVFLNTTEAVYSGGSNGGVFGQTSGFTSTQFQLGGPDNITYHNENGSSYVAYLFAHNNNDGEFGPDADQDIIKCGSYTGNGSASGPSINLGFEPQWVIIKKTDNVENWYIYDSMRGVVTGPHDNGLDRKLIANSSSAEGGLNFNDPINFGSTGFNIGTTDNELNNNGSTYIYMAIRRGPLAAPEDATKVFAMSTKGATTPPPAWVSGFPVDFALETIVDNTGGFLAASRLTSGKYLDTSSTAAEQDYSNYTFDYNNGWSGMTGVNSNNQSWMWKRAPSYFDVVAYKGTGSGNLQISHNLGVAPEMMWVKIRSGATNDWVVYHKDLPTSGNTKKSLFLNSTSAGGYGDYFANASSVHVAPTSSVFTLGSEAAVNGSSSYNYIAYLFATVAGVSKVGSYTGNGSTQNIDCGFSSGARFVFTKRTDATGSWYVHDTVRGIVASGNDPVLQLNNTAAENTFDDYIDPHSSGFSVKSSSLTNASGGSYIFYAIA